MAANDKPPTEGEGVTINPRDIFFECPACNKSLVVDETAEGMMVECPKCHITVIVPPKSRTAMPPPPTASREAPARPAGEAVPASAGLAEVHQRLNVLASQLREQQTQWTEVTNRIASRINEVNRELVVLGRLETSHKQVLKEWNHLVSEVAAASHAVAQQPPPAVPQK